MICITAPAVMREPRKAKRTISTHHETKCPTAVITFLFGTIHKCRQYRAGGEIERRTNSEYDQYGEVA